MKKIIATLLCLFAATASAEGVVNVYTWGGYVPSDVLRLFEKETGIHVNYSSYDSDNVLYTKLKTNPNAGYDVVMPSADYVTQMIQQDMLEPLDHSKIPNSRYLNPELLNHDFDTNNQYSFPFTWGTVGILVNDRYYDPKSITTFQYLWRPEFRNQLLAMDDPKDMFAVAMQVLGYPINDTDPQHILQAYLKLSELLPNIKLFTVSNTGQIFCDGDVTIGIAESGEANQGAMCDPHLHYIYPQHQGILWIENLVIPKNAPNVENAYKFINFLMEPRVALMIFKETGYSSPNLAAIKLLPKKLQANPITNPPAADLEGAQVEAFLGNQTTALLLSYWQRLKLQA